MIFHILNFIFFSAFCDVVELNSTEFEKAIAEKPSFIVFYQKWCSFSSAFLNVLDPVATQMSDSNLLFGKVDCAKERFLCQLHVEEGYPTVKLFQRDTSVQFKENRTVEGITKWLELNLLPPYTQAESNDDINSFKLKYDYTLVGHFPSVDIPEFKAFATAANNTQTKAARIVSIDSSLKSPSLSLFHRADNETETFAGDWTADAISRFEQSRAAPFVEELSPFNGRYLSGQKMPVLYFFLDSQSPTFAAQRRELVQVSRAFRDKLMVALCDTRRFGRLRKQLGLNETEFPSYAIECLLSYRRPSASPRAKMHFCPTPLTTNRLVTADELKAFAASFLDGSLRPFIRSLPPPPTQFRAVQRLVGSTFEDVVFDPQRDVLVRLVVPWCLTCNRTAPIFELVAQDLRNAAKASSSPAEKKKKELAERIVLAEMDVSENDPPPDVVVYGHPTVLLFPAENKANPILCPTWFSYEKMKEFLRTELLKQPRWKGTEDDFPLSLDLDAIADEDDLMEFDKNMEKHLFAQRTTPGDATEAAPDQPRSEL